MGTALASFLPLALIACSDQSATGPLRSRADDGQDARIDAIERLAQEAASPKGAPVSATDTGFTVIPADIGVLTFRIDEVSPKANGVDLKLKVGNPTAATITTLSIDATWYAKNSQGTLEQRGSLNDVRLNGRFIAGSWTDTTISLSDIKSDEFDYVYIQDVQAISITLGTP